MNTLKRYAMFSSLVCLALALVPSVGRARAGTPQRGEADFAAIDAYVTEQMSELGIPGLALGIVQEGQVAHLRGFGVADASGRAVTPQTPFTLGSVTKSFTALAVMQLVEAGQIDLDAPVQTYLPWFALADKEASATITVRHLLNQTSGIRTSPACSVPVPLDARLFPQSRLWLDRGRSAWDRVERGLYGELSEKVEDKPRLTRRARSST